MAPPAPDVAVEWVAAWNALDLSRVAALLAEGVVFRSRGIKRVLERDSVVLEGRSAVVDYFERCVAGASRSPGFEIVAAHEGDDRVFLEYTRRSGERCCEVFVLSPDRLIEDGTAYYL